MASRFRIALVVLLTLTLALAKGANACQEPPKGVHFARENLEDDIVLSIVSESPEVKSHWSVKGVHSDHSYSGLVESFAMYQDGPLWNLVTTKGLAMPMRGSKKIKVFKVSVDIQCVDEEKQNNVHVVLLHVFADDVLEKIPITVPENTPTQQFIYHDKEKRTVPSPRYKHHALSDLEDASRFLSLNNMTGSVTLVKPLDYERDPKVMWYLTVKMTKPRQNKLRLFRIQIGNVNDNSPEFYQSEACRAKRRCKVVDYSFTLDSTGNFYAENENRIHAVDMDGDVITYSIVQAMPQQNFITINERTGELSAKRPGPQVADRYVLTVKASDGYHASDAAVVINVENDQPVDEFLELLDIESWNDGIDNNEKHDDHDDGGEKDESTSTADDTMNPLLPWISGANRPSGGASNTEEGVNSNMDARAERRHKAEKEGEDEEEEEEMNPKIIYSLQPADVVAKKTITPPEKPGPVNNGRDNMKNGGDVAGADDYGNARPSTSDANTDSPIGSSSNINPTNVEPRRPLSAGNANRVTERAPIGADDHIGPQNNVAARIMSKENMRKKFLDSINRVLGVSSASYSSKNVTKLADDSEMIGGGGRNNSFNTTGSNNSSEIAAVIDEEEVLYLTELCGNLSLILQQQRDEAEQKERAEMTRNDTAVEPASGWNTSTSTSSPIEESTRGSLDDRRRRRRRSSSSVDDEGTVAGGVGRVAFTNDTFAADRVMSRGSHRTVVINGTIVQDDSDWFGIALYSRNGSAMTIEDANQTCANFNGSNVMMNGLDRAAATSAAGGMTSTPIRIVVTCSVWVLLCHLI